ncbi:MAG TPA: TonB-dependent receptor [Chakrabartia sp.]|jgi:iron complex outermembrane receptor protein|nr:TonB-dependent receptor [Chakrabartia sp.]
MKISMRHLALTASIVPFLALSAPAWAQNAADDEADTGEIVVTGSSIKGVAPVGSNLTTVGRAELEDLGVQTVQQVLKTVPSVVGLQSAGQGGYGSFDGAGTNAPTIHGLGASASNSTLVLLNGHRLPVTGLNHVLADPNIVAPMALERVEVLADGASSVYGSDAVAGVINFITRRNVNGLEATVQKGFGKQYSTFNAGILGGKTWETGSFLVSYNFSDRSNLAAADRSFARANQTARGGRNFTTNRCSPASITVGANTFYTPYTAAGSVAGDCDPSLYWDLIPSEKRHSLFASVQQDVTDSLELTADFIYSNRTNVQQVSRGNASGTIYAAGATLPAGRSVNPFTSILATLPGAPTSATVNFNADQLLGTGATITGSAETFYGRLDANYTLSDAWSFNVGGLIGKDKAKQVNVGQLNTAVFNLALNGATTASINGVNQTVTQALTAGNAIDVFGGNTSAATKALLTDNRQLFVGDQSIKNVYAKLAGDMFELPGGMSKVAIGGEYIGYTLKQDIVRGNSLGAASTNSTNTHIDYKRNVKSAYVELYLPIIKDSVVKSFDLNISGRIDDYSDFGTTKNPKIAANLEVVEGVKFRGNWARSFVAPALTSRGANAAGLTGESGFSGVTGSGLPGGAPTISYANFPTAVNIPGCPAAPATSCSLASISGVLLAGGNGNLKPQKGKAFSFGVDIAPVAVPGLNISVTYWSNKLRGGITAPVPSLALGAADLSYLLQLYPTGATAAQIAAASAGLPQTAPLQTNTYFIYNYQQNNVLNLNVTGLDVSASYHFDTSIGKFNISAAATRKLKFDQFFGAGGQVFSVLGTAGFNTTFPSVKTEARFNLGYEGGGFNANIFYNYLGKYRNWSSSVANPLVRTNGVPTSGGDVVKSFATVDLNLAYKLKDMGFLNEAQIFVDTTNLFDKAPPQYNVFLANGAAGYDNINASPIGRVVTIGLRTKF